VASKPLRIVAIGVGSESFGRGILADVLGSQEFNDLDCTLVLVDLNEEALERMHKLAVLLKEHFGSTVKLERTTDRRQALPGASYVIISVAIRRYPLWEQDFRVPMAYGFKQSLAENGGPGALFHAMRNFEQVIPICHDMEELCPDAPVLNFTNPESRIAMAIHAMTKIKAFGLCHGVITATSGASAILERPQEDLDIVSGGLNHFFWFTKVADRKTGEDLYPKLRERICNDPDCPSAPPLVRKMVEIFGHYTYPGPDHIGEYLSFAHEFTGLKWPFGQECRSVPKQADDSEQSWLDKYVSGEKPMDERVAGRSSELAIPIILGVEMNRKSWAAAVNVPNDGAYVAELPTDAVVEVPAWVDGSGVHPQKIGPLPEAISAFCRTQVSLQKLLIQAYIKRSKNLLLQALLLDPVVHSVANAERMLDDMLELQKDYLPEFS